ncbi:hypothetical protein DFS34DRAFT_18218 [Phlyctochytrium arcticum]|nr:hypothetical protein DFS34DRAFT_18218 [Phlyctochytrium arcticum]
MTRRKCRQEKNVIVPEVVERSCKQGFLVLKWLGSKDTAYIYAPGNSRSHPPSEPPRAPARDMKGHIIHNVKRSPTECHDFGICGSNGLALRLWFPAYERTNFSSSKMKCARYDLHLGPSMSAVFSIFVLVVHLGEHFVVSNKIEHYQRLNNKMMQVFRYSKSMQLAGTTRRYNSPSRLFTFFRSIGTLNDFV